MSVSQLSDLLLWAHYGQNHKVCCVEPAFGAAPELFKLAADGSQRMLKALELGMVMPIHRHHASTEMVVILRGKIRRFFYDENGNETERATLDADGWPRMLNVEKGRWHSQECLESGSGLFGCKDGGIPSRAGAGRIIQEALSWRPPR